MNITMNVTVEGEDTPEFENTFIARFSESAISYAPVSSQSGPKVFLFKVAAESDDDVFFLALPTLLLKGEMSKTTTIDNFIFSRSITGLDTIEHKNVYEEAWVVDEIASYGEQVVMSGTYWYGRSGLLRLPIECDDIPAHT